MHRAIGVAAAWLILVQASLAQQRPAPAPTTGPTTQPGFPQQLLSEALDTFHKAPKARLDIDAHFTQTALDPISSVQHQAMMNERSDEPIHISWVRPSKLAIVSRREMNNWRVLFDGTTLALLIRGPVQPEAGYGGVVEECTVDDVFAARRSMFGINQRSVALVLEEGSYNAFFKYSRDFKWLGAARDNGVPVWQIAFTDADDQPWQMSITQGLPHRIVRVVNEHDGATGFVDVVNGKKPTDQLTADDVVSYSYQVHVRSEFHFRSWDSTAADDESAFKIPNVKLAPQDFFGEAPRFVAGDAIEITALETPDGNRIEPADTPGLVVITFWRDNGYEKDVVPEKLGKLLREFDGKGVKWLAIDAVDRTARAKQFLARNKLKGDHVFIAPTPFWRDQFKVDTHGGDVMIANTKDGKLLYYGASVYGGVEMAKLREALETATGAKPQSGGGAGSAVLTPSTAPTATPSPVASP
jgi:hypothetical protein